jgi:hypothetical protein
MTQPLQTKQVHAVRLDVRKPSGPVFYFFVEPHFGAVWDEWWAKFYSLLLALATDVVWKYEPVQDKWCAQRTLSHAEKERVAAEIRRAPASELSRVRTLQQAHRSLSESGELLGVMFFSFPDRSEASNDTDD